MDRTHRFLYNDSVSVQEIQSKIKGFLSNEKAYGVALILAIASASFGAGRVSNLVSGDTNAPITHSASASMATEEQNPTAKVEQVITPKAKSSSDVVPESKGETKAETETAPKSMVTAPAQATDSRGVYVGSKNGTKYHLPWCSGAKNIKEENKIWFGSKEDAASKGYSPASNCKGI